MPVTLTHAAAGATLTVTWQGCADAGFCYPPETKIVPLGNALAQSGDKKPMLNPPLPLETRPALPVESPADLAPPATDEKSADLPFSALWALLIGIGIAFTPCVLPMYPLISGIVLGGQKRLSTARALLLACTSTRSEWGCR